MLVDHIEDFQDPRVDIENQLSKVCICSWCALELRNDAQDIFGYPLGVALLQCLVEAVHSLSDFVKVDLCSDGVVLIAEQVHRVDIVQDRLHTAGDERLGISRVDAKQVSHHKPQEPHAIKSLGVLENFRKLCRFVENIMLRPGNQ